MSPVLGSFATHLPYWTTLRLPGRAGSDAADNGVAVLVLKDGTLAQGMRITGLELEGASDADLNRHAEVIAQALASLPADAYLQCIFESGDDFQDVCGDFAGRSSSDSHPVLQRGRAERARLLRGDPYLTRCRITYWLGWRGALNRSAARRGVSWQGVWRTLRDRFVAPSAAGLVVDAATTLAAGRLLVEAGERLRDILGGIGLATRYLSEPQVLSELHRAINPTWPGAAGLRAVRAERQPSVCPDHPDGPAFRRAQLWRSGSAPQSGPPRTSSQTALYLGMGPSLPIFSFESPRHQEYEALHAAEVAGQSYHCFKLAVLDCPVERDSEYSWLLGTLDPAGSAFDQVGTHLALAVMDLDADALAAVLKKYLRAEVTTAIAACYHEGMMLLYWAAQPRGDPG